MRRVGPENLIDHIYEAAALPNLWPDVLDGVADLGQTLNGVLYAVTPGGTSPAESTTKWTSSESAAETIAQWMREGWAERNLLIERTLQLNRAGFVRDQDLCTPEEIEHEPVYKSLRQIGYGWNAGFVAQAPTGDILTFAWNRAYADGPYSRETLTLLDPLRPHLARASLMSSRLGLERARAATATLALLGLPAAVLSPLHRIIAANDLLENLMPQVLEERAFGRFRIRDPVADKLLSQALSNAVALPAHHAPPPAAVFSVPLPATSDQPAMVVHVLPIRRGARDVFHAGATIVIVTPVSGGAMPSASVVQGLFDLTAAEARVARQIGGGQTVGEVAAQSNTSEATVRSQLKAVFAKTGVSRQSELVGLLGSIDLVRPPPR